METTPVFEVNTAVPVGSNMRTASAPFATPGMLLDLAAPTPKSEIKTKPGRGGSGQLSFIDARFVFDRFDTVLGASLWQLEIGWSQPIELEPRLNRNNQPIEGTEAHGSYPLARIGVLCESGWVWRQDIGSYSDIESVKGGVSDAIKRTAVQWGVGRDLYDPESEARSTNSLVPARAEQVGQAEQAVVGQRGLTDHDRKKLFANLNDAGMTGDKRKAFVFLAVGKHSVKDMTSEDLDAVLAVLNAPKDEHPEVWENVEMVSGD